MAVCGAANALLQFTRRCTGVLSSSCGKRVTKARWSSDEDDKLKRLVDRHGMDDFQTIASFFEVSSNVNVRTFKLPWIEQLPPTGI